MRIGAHVDPVDPVAEAAARGADLVQIFLGDPQGWKDPAVAHSGGFDGLRAAVAEAGIDLYVHAPYRLNVATANNRIRIPSRQLLAKYAAAVWPPARPATDAMFTIVPFVAMTCGSSYFMHRNTPVRLVAMMRSHIASSYFAIDGIGSGS